MAFGQPAGLQVTQFRIQLENYPPPHEAQVKTLLEGSKGQPQPDDTIVVTDVRLKTLGTNGAIELLAETPSCIFDRRSQTATSSESLKLQTGDRRFVTEGEGFLWSQTNSNLIISNRVHTTVRRDLLGAPAGRQTTAAPAGEENIDVFSDSRVYNRISGRAEYLGHVRVAGTNLQITAERLLLEFPEPGAPLSGVVADGNVIMDRGDLHATGERATYYASNEVAVITGNPTWRRGRQQGRGDQLILDRANSTFRADGHAYVKLPREGGESGLLLDSSPAQTENTTNRYVEITSDSYTISTNLASFRNHVVGSEFDGERPQGRLTCGQMLVTFGASNQIDRLTAHDHVKVDQKDAHITSDEAVFFGTNSIAQFRGSPSWQMGAREGSGDVLMIDRLKNELSARGNAKVRLPASQVRIIDMSPGAGTNRAPEASERQMIDITSDAYDLTQDTSRFWGKVHAKNPRGRLLSERLTVDLSQGGGEEHRTATAERGKEPVEIVWVDSDAKTNYAWSDKAVYSYALENSTTNELVTLTGHPVITNSQGTHTGDPIIWDRVHNTIHAAQPKSIVLDPKTNSPAGLGFPDKPRTNAVPAKPRTHP